MGPSVILHPANINNLPWELETDRLKSFVSQHTARLVPVDETYKLDFTGGLLGGGGAQSTSSGGGGNDDSGSYGSSEHQDYGSKDFGDFRDYGPMEQCLAVSSLCEGNPNCQPQVSTCIDRVTSSESSHDFGRSYGKNGGSDGGYQGPDLSQTSNPVLHQINGTMTLDSVQFTAELIKIHADYSMMMKGKFVKIAHLTNKLSIDPSIEMKGESIHITDRSIEIVNGLINMSCSVLRGFGLVVPQAQLNRYYQTANMACGVFQGAKILNAVKAPASVTPLPARPTGLSMASKPMAAAPAKPAPAPAKHVGSHQPFQAPEKLPAFPDAVRVKGGSYRERWADKRYTYEWDKQHGRVEKYHTGNRDHIGEFDYVTGIQTKPANPNRKLIK